MLTFQSASEKTIRSKLAIQSRNLACYNAINIIKCEHVVIARTQEKVFAYFSVRFLRTHLFGIMKSCTTWQERRQVHQPSKPDMTHASLRVLTVTNALIAPATFLLQATILQKTTYDSGVKDSWRIARFDTSSCEDCILFRLHLYPCAWAFRDHNTESLPTVSRKTRTNSSIDWR